MAVNADKPQHWKDDIAKSVDHYNNWFLRFAPKAYRDTRQKTTSQVELALKWTRNLRSISPTLLREHPEVLQILRMSTAPPLARDRLIGLTGVPKGLVTTMEGKGKLPPHMDQQQAGNDLKAIGTMIRRLADPDIFPWVQAKETPSEAQVYRAASIVADRLCGAVADPIVRNAQERRQLNVIKAWLRARKYKFIPAGKRAKFSDLKSGTFAFHLNVPVALNDGRQVNIPVDVAVMPLKAAATDLPLLIEAKSAGDFTNVNKRRKEEATKIVQLRRTYGETIRYVLFLCGYFDSGYLGYEAAEGIDWIWEHRVNDFAEFGL